MKPRHVTAALGILCAMTIGSAANADNTPISPSNLHLNTPHLPLLFAPVIKGVKYSCGSPSGSSVFGTLVNKNGIPQTYTPVFTGKKLDECTAYYPADCSGLPAGSFCIPTKCKTTKPGATVVIKGSPVTVPANGQKSASIGVPNADFQSATFSVGSVKAAVVPLPHTCLF